MSLSVARRESLLLACVALPLMSAAACPADLADGLCGFSADAVDEVDDGIMEAKQNGESFSEEATWAPGANASVDAGIFSLIIPVDETGTAFDDLVADGAFPFCVPLGKRDDTTGVANYIEGGYVSNDDHVGNVLIVNEEDGILSGRFEVDMFSIPNDDVMTFTDGVFRAERR